MTWKSVTNQFVSFRRSRGNPAPDEINCRCLSNDNHGARRRGGGDGEIMAGHLAFLQAFPNLACFSPSFSKQSFGGFVGFQGVTRVPSKRGKSAGVRERSLSAAFLERAWSERKPRGQRPRRLQREDIGCGCLCDHGGLGAWAATISARAGMCRQPGTLRRAPR